MAGATSGSGPPVKGYRSIGSRSVATKRMLPVLKPPSGALAVSCARRNRILGTYPHNPQKQLILRGSLYALNKTAEIG